MTQHSLLEDTVEDRQIIRRLAAVVGCFVAATAIMAVVIAVVMG